jgi:hypothetical protein
MFSNMVWFSSAITCLLVAGVVVGGWACSQSGSWVGVSVVNASCDMVEMYHKFLFLNFSGCLGFKGEELNSHPCVSMVAL